MLNNAQTFVGRFVIGESEYTGQIEIDNKTGQIFLLLTISTDGFGNNYNKFEYIHGSVGDGRSFVTLINCKYYNGHTYFGSHQNLCLTAEYIFFSGVVIEKFEFSDYQVELENALRWSGLSCIDRADFNHIHFNKHKSVTFKFNDFIITFISVVTKNLKYYPVEEENSIEERLMMKIHCDSKKNYADFLSIRDLFISIISFCIKNNVNILKQEFEDADIFYQPIIGQSVPYKHRLYENVNNKQIFELCHESEMNFTLNMISADFFSDTNNISKIEKLKPIFNLYLSLFKYQDMPQEMIFLNIVQAIETYHSRFKFERKAKYREHVFSMQNNEEFEILYKPLLWDSSQSDVNCSFITLHSRINDLMISASNNLFRCLFIRDDFAQRICNTRHYLTHYDAKKESTALKGEELSKAIYMLELVLEYYVCLEFGIDREPYIRNELMQILH